MLRESKGNMYGFVTHTWNAIKGKCPHGCTYCYMKRWGKQKPPRMDEKEFKTDLGAGNYIFVGSSYDMFTGFDNVIWGSKVIEYCREFDNTYLFQTKNSDGFYFYESIFPQNTVLCITLETNRHYSKIMGMCPPPVQRVVSFMRAYERKMITIEPIMDFDLIEFYDMIHKINPEQVNIGADSGNNNLPEPPREKIENLIEKLRQRNIKVIEKANLKRLMKG